MNEGKVKILEMLQEGKITVQESLELLKQFEEEQPSPPYMDDYDDEAMNFEERLDGIFDNIGNIVSSNLDKAGRNIDKALNNAEGFSEFSIGGKNVKIVAFGPGTKPGIGKSFASRPITGDIAFIKLMSKNSPVQIKGYAGDTVQINVKYNPKRKDAQVVIQEEGGGFEVLYDYNAMRWLGIECLVPNALVNQIHGESKNSSIVFSDVRAGNAVLITKNSNIKIRDINCHSLLAKTGNSNLYARNVVAHELDLQTSNSKIETENVKAHIARLTTSNAKIELEDIDANEIYVKTSNASVKLDNAYWETNEAAEPVATVGSQYPPGHEKAPKSERIVDIKTSNASIGVGVPADAAVKLQASTSNGGVQCKLQNLIANEVSKNYFNGKTYDYESRQKQVKLNLSSSNGAIKIKEV